jgi:hypothetical protein
MDSNGDHVKNRRIILRDENGKDNVPQITDKTIRIEDVDAEGNGTVIALDTHSGNLIITRKTHKRASFDRAIVVGPGGAVYVGPIDDQTQPHGRGYWINSNDKFVDATWDHGVSREDTTAVVGSRVDGYRFGNVKENMVSSLQNGMTWVHPTLDAVCYQKGDQSTIASLRSTYVGGLHPDLTPKGSGILVETEPCSSGLRVTQVKHNEYSASHVPSRVVNEINIVDKKLILLREDSLRTVNVPLMFANLVSKTKDTQQVPNVMTFPSTLSSTVLPHHVAPSLNGITWIQPPKAPARKLSPPIVYPHTLTPYVPPTPVPITIGTPKRKSDEVTEDANKKPKQ